MPGAAGWRETAGGERAGFLVAEIADGRAHLSEVSVRRAAQGLGIGRALVATFLDWARAEGFAEATLTTFRDLHFNAPFYATLGFREVLDLTNRPQLTTLRRNERDLDRLAPRVAMALTL